MNTTRTIFYNNNKAENVLFYIIILFKKSIYFICQFCSLGKNNRKIKIKIKIKMLKNDLCRMQLKSGV